VAGRILVASNGDTTSLLRWGKFGKPKKSIRDTVAIGAGNRDIKLRTRCGAMG
jgi:hypothetical protein